MKHKDYLHKFNNLTLTQRITWLTGGVVFLLGFLLVVFINAIAPIFITHSVGSPNTQILVETVDETGRSITILAETPSPKGYTTLQDVGITWSDPLTVVKVLSMIGLFTITAMGFMASKWIARTSLKQVKEISKAAHEISARTLDQRLNYQGASDEIKILADDFDSMLQRLQNNFRSQREFNSNLAHELRTPITAIRMNLEVLTADTNASIEEYREYVVSTERSLVRLNHLVEDLLLLATGEDEFSQQPIILSVMIEEIIEELSPIAASNHVKLEMSGDSDLEITGDPILMYRAFANLIENGIRYNRPDGFVAIMSKKENDEVIIEIRDNGIGISEDQLAYIFGRFYRCKTSGRKNDGKGLGLALTAHIIQLHHGRINVESTIGEGSIFRIFLKSR